MALLAGVGTGVWSSVPEACDATITTRRQTHPRRATVERYKALYPEYGRLYHNLRDDFKRIAALHA
ncbi:MAG: hypothetical protein WBD63_11740 [Phycisphaerae bacterium]